MPLVTFHFCVCTILRLPCLVVQTFLLKQLLVRAEFSNPTAIKNDDFICVANGTDAVRNDYLCYICNCFNCVLELLLRLHVECRSGIVENKNRRLLCKCTCNGKALFLAATQTNTAFTNANVFNDCV